MRLFFLVIHCKAKQVVFNRRTLCVEESVHVVCDKTNFIVQENSLEDEDADFQDKDTTLEDETKVEELEQSKEITATPLIDLPRE